MPSYGTEWSAPSAKPRPDFRPCSRQAGKARSRTEAHRSLAKALRSKPRLVSPAIPKDPRCSASSKQVAPGVTEPALAIPQGPLELRCPRGPATRLSASREACSSSSPARRPATPPTGRSGLAFRAIARSSRRRTRRSQALLPASQRPPAARGWPPRQPSPTTYWRSSPTWATTGRRPPQPRMRMQLRSDLRPASGPSADASPRPMWAAPAHPRTAAPSSPGLAGNLCRSTPTFSTSPELWEITGAITHSGPDGEITAFSNCTVTKPISSWPPAPSCKIVESWQPAA